MVELEEPALNALLQDFYWNELGAFWPPERRHVEDGYRGLPFPFDPVEPPSVTLTQAWSLAHFAGYVRSWSAVARYQEALEVDPVLELERRLAGHWGPGTRTLGWPLSIRAGRR